MARYALVVGMVVLVALSFAVFHAPANDEPKSDPNAKASIWTPPKEVPVTAAMRRDINRTLDAFVPAAVERQNPSLAYALATPNLRASATRRQWERGEIPVMPFAAKGKAFHGWTLNYSIKNNVNVDLMVPASAEEKELQAIAYTVDLRRINGRWRVSEFFPTAQFRKTAAANGSNIVAQPDLAPQAKMDGTTHTGEDATERYVALVPMFIVGFGLALVIGLFLVQYAKGRRAERDYLAGRL